ncbi:hypothetical protein E4U27_001273 [Claviceps purpurea]|nr:hypothetical protein E4U27_001273 [Claviceps purpurea]
MSQPTPIDAKTGADPAPTSDEHADLAVAGKRKRDSETDGAEAMMGVEEEEQKPTAPARWAAGEQKDLIKNYFEVLTSIDIEPSILKRPLANPQPLGEPEAKRQKPLDSPTLKSISDKIAADEYTHMEDVAADIICVTNAALLETESTVSEKPGNTTSQRKLAASITDFKDQALRIFEREKAYPNAPAAEPIHGVEGSKSVTDKSKAILSVVGYAPHERPLFSSLPLSQDIDPTEYTLPPGVTFTRVIPSNVQERIQTLGELFSSPRPLLPLQPPKQPKTQAKGNTLDFYYPMLENTSKYRGNCYFNTKLSTGHYLDYSSATPSHQTKTRQRERAQSLAGKRPSSLEVETSEMEALFRGAFSSFAPCKDDSAAVISSGVAGRMWWQQSGSRYFQRMIEHEYYPDTKDADPFKLRTQIPPEIDEEAIREAIDNWDESIVDPSLDDFMGSKRDENEKEINDILDEVTDMIETLASYQRIRNLTLPNSQNRQSSDPVNGDMLANSGPHQPSEEEQATYEMLKAQLTLIIKTLPPYAVAKLNGDQLEELLISTKIQIQTDHYRGVMEEDDASVQARIRAQQQQHQHQQAAAQAVPTSVRPPSQRSGSISTPYGNQYHPNQYSTPSRTPSHNQQYFRSMPTPNYQVPPPSRTTGSPAAQPPRPPQPNQYTRPNGYPNQYAAQLAKSQTPYGHQNMPQYANQPRPPYAQQLPPQGAPTAARLQYQQKQPATPGPPKFAGPYTNGGGGGGVPPRNLSPQVPPRHAFSPPNVPPGQRFAGPPSTPHMNRNVNTPGQHPQFSQSPGLTGYHTVIPEAQQQRILDQAKARVAAQDRSGAAQGGHAGAGTGAGMGYGAGGVPAGHAGQRQGANGTPMATPVATPVGTPGTQYVPPSKVTPVPVPPIPGAGGVSQQQQPQQQQQTPQQQQPQQPVSNPSS